MTFFPEYDTTVNKNKENHSSFNRPSKIFILLFELATKYFPNQAFQFLY